MSYQFIFGNTPDLSYAETVAVLSRQGIIAEELSFNPPVLHLETNLEIKQNVFGLLGGTVKVARVFQPAIAATRIIQSVADVLKKIPAAKINFGLSSYTSGYQVQLKTCKDIKELIQEENKKVRFVLPAKGEGDLSSVVVKKQKLYEIIVTEKNRVLQLGETIWVQDFSDWNKRDYGRPVVSAHIGMLPPKVARMMVNIALPVDNPQQQVTILDPFCGSGTILAEALVLGVKVLGADLDPNQVTRTKENLSWLTKEYQLSNGYTVLQHDARRISEDLNGQKVDAVVTEPDLGPTNLGQGRSLSIKNIIPRLEKLYLDCLADWTKILKPGGRVVIILPEYSIRDGMSHLSVDLKTIIDKAQVMGYSVLAGPYQYFRPQAIVRRNIYVLSYGTH